VYLCKLFGIAEVSFGLLLYLQGGIVNVTYLCHSHTVIMICPSFSLWSCALSF